MKIGGKLLSRFIVAGGGGGYGWGRKGAVILRPGQAEGHDAHAFPVSLSLAVFLCVNQRPPRFPVVSPFLNTGQPERTLARNFEAQSWNTYA